MARGDYRMGGPSGFWIVILLIFTALGIVGSIIGLAAGAIWLMQHIAIN